MAPKSLKGQHLLTPPPKKNDRTFQQKGRNLRSAPALTRRGHNFRGSVFPFPLRSTSFYEPKVDIHYIPPHTHTVGWIQGRSQGRGGEDSRPSMELSRARLRACLAAARGLQRAPQGLWRGPRRPRRTLSGHLSHKFVSKQLAEVKWGPFRTNTISSLQWVLLIWGGSSQVWNGSSQAWNGLSGLGWPP